MCNEHSKHKRGISLKDKEAHSEDHKNWSRRNFIQTLGLTTGAGMALGGFSVSALGATSLMPALVGGDNDDRVLVLIRLKGGNDGLNTIIPTFDYGTYQSLRPQIGIPTNQIIQLNDKYGMPNTMANLEGLWNDGSMKVINTVGYEDHNLSHFTSSDIVSSAKTDYAANPDKSGWLGRYILNNNPDYLENLPAAPGAIKISSGSSITYYNPDMIDLAVNFNTPDRLLQIAETGFVYDTENLPDDCYYGDQVGFLRSILNVTFNYAPEISTAFGVGSNDVAYSNNELSRQLSIVAKLIKGNLGTKLYMVTLDGFDTHENQNNSHPVLMNNLSNAISEFYADLATTEKDKCVLSMTFSEFGRRIEQNASGTDHGTAAPVMLFGAGVNGNGFLGDDPDLINTDNNGNLHHSIDFRQIYATVLEQWLCVDPVDVDSILGDSFERLDMGLECMSVSTADIPIKQRVTHWASDNGMGGTDIHYELDRPGNVNLSIYTMMGQKVQTLVNGYQFAGKQRETFSNRTYGFSTLPLIYRIEANGKVYSGKFVAVNN